MPAGFSDGAERKRFNNSINKAISISGRKRLARQRKYDI
jgi:hypothetical protein